MKNHSLSTLVGINLIFVFGASLLGPLYAIYVKQEIGGDILTIGWAFAIYMITVGVVSYIAGKMGDKIKEKEYLLAVGYLIRAVGFFCYTLISTIGGLFLLQLFLGIGEAIANPSFKSIYSIHLDNGRESTQWGIWDMSYSIIVGIATIIGAMIVNSFGFDILFYSMSLLAVIALLVLLFQPRKLL